MAGMLCAIHQPNFLPRLSTLAKLYAADIWIILDDVQFTRRDYQHRCYLAPVHDTRLPGQWLTLPVHLPGGRETLIRDARLAEPARTAKRASGILRQYFRRAPYRTDVLDLIPGIEETITGTERLADLTRAVGASSYLCGTGGSRYLDQAPFAALGIDVTMFAPPEHAADLSPEDARRASVLADLAAAGPKRLSAAMRAHAQLIRDAGTSAGDRISVSKRPVSVREPPGRSDPRRRQPRPPCLSPAP